jgi:hypothetical protein
MKNACIMFEPMACPPLRYSSALLNIKFVFWFWFYAWKNSQSEVFISSIRCSCEILTNRQVSRRIFEVVSYIKFQENLSSGNRFVLCGQTDGEAGYTTKLIVTFRCFANAPNSYDLLLLLLSSSSSSMTLQPSASYDLLVHEVSWSHTTKRHSQ